MLRTPTRMVGSLKRVKAVRNGKTTYWVYSSLLGKPVFQDAVSDNEQTQYLSGGETEFRLQPGDELRAS